MCGAHQHLHAQTIRKDSLRVSVPDSVGMRYERGKWVMPSRQSIKDWRTSNAKDSDGPDSLKQISQKSIDKSKSLIDTDSVNRLALRVDETVKEVRTFDKKSVFSKRKLKALYDSMGVGKADTLKHLASLREEVGEDQMIDKINQSFSPDSGSYDALRDVSRSTLRQEALQELSPLGGMQLASPYKQVADSILRQQLMRVDSVEALRRLTFPDSINADSLKRSLQMDTLQSLASEHQDSLLAKIPSAHVRDSLMQAIEQRRLAATRMKTDGLDTARSFVLSKNKDLRMKREKMRDDVEHMQLQEREGFWDKLYFDGIASINKTGEQNDIQLSPSVGFEVTSNFSVGAGPVIHLRQEQRSADLTGGYRAFMRYEIFNQRAYLQAEDNATPVPLREDARFAPNHRLLAGVGGFIPVVHSFALNVALLYNINSEAGPASTSAWVFRLGISSVRNKKIKK